MTIPLRFEGFSLRVSDVERSLAFYRDQLGFTVEQQHGRMFALLGLGEGTIGLLRGDLARWPVEAREQFHIELSTGMRQKSDEAWQGRSCSGSVATLTAA